MKKICLLLSLLFAFQMLFSQESSNKGKEFYIAYPAHIDGTGSVMGLYITSDVNTSGTVQVGSGTTVNFTVLANQVTRVFLGTGTSGIDASNIAVYLNMSDGIKTNAAIKINTLDPVVVYSHIIKSARSGATLALPTTVLGSEYIVPSIASNEIMNASNNGTNGGIGEIVVIATQPNTTVEITPTAAGLSGKPAGTPFTITLTNAGDCYQFQAAARADLSGSKVSSSGCKAIAVFSATTWSNFDCANASGGDNLYQQLFPTRSWGKQFVTAPFINRPNDIYRIFVQNSTTTVSIQDNGVTTTLNASSYNANGKFYTYRTSNPVVIKGSEPISVVQYISSQTCKTGCATGTTNPQCYADPEMVLLNPVEQTLNDITFFSAHAAYVPQGQTNVLLHFVNIIVSKAYTSTVKIDGAAPKGLFKDIPGSNYAYLQEDLTVSSNSNPIHRVTADTNFSAIVYGYGNVESYGYNGGTNLKDFSRTAALQNPFQHIDSAVTCVNTPFQFSVPLTFQPNTITWDFSAAPNINPNATVGPTTSPSVDSMPQVNGQTLYYYSTKQTYQFTKANTPAQRDTIKLYTTSATPDGCGSTSHVYTVPIKVNDKPVAGFAFTHSGCAADSVYFTDQSTTVSGQLIRWQWDFGDATSADIFTTAISKKYANGGDYTVKLKAISNVGCVSDEATKIIHVTSKPVASFTTTAVACIDGDITFTDASSSTVGTLGKWTWNLDNGAGPVTFTTNTPQTTKYTSYGNKNVTLQVETTTGCKSDVFSPTTPVHINPLPEPGFTLPEVCQNDAFAQFTDTSKIVEGTIKSYLWKFNDGSPAITPPPNTASSTAKDPAVHYNIYGNYKVSLSVTSQLGCVATKTVDFTVNGSTPKADFEFVNAAPYCDNKPVQLKNKSTVDFGNVTKLEIYWDFVNNPTVKETIETPVTDGIYPHIYPNLQLPNAQQYAIRVVAYSGSASSCSNELTKTITVYSQPKAAFNTSVSELCFGDIVNFTDLSNGVSGAITTWIWDLGKGDKSAAQNPSKQYNDSGAMQVSLYVVNAVGCTSDTAVKQLTVYANPKLTLTNNMTVLVGGTITLAPVYVYGNDLQYKWTPPAYLSSDTASKPQAMPIDDITYRLTVTAQGGCAVSDTVFIRVLKSPDVPNAFSPNGDGINDTWKIKYLEGYPGATVDVFNRYGQAVFKSAGYNSEWNGTLNGNPLPVGTYYYIINPKNGRQIITGSVTIIK